MLNTNIVEKEKLRKVQLETLKTIMNSLANSFGPYGSNTMIIRNTVASSYTKDGLKILNEIKFKNPIEHHIARNIVEISRDVAKRIGDGTTSAIILSYFILENINRSTMLDKVPPAKIVKMIKDVANRIGELIRNKTKETTPEDIYNIAYISTNGNEDIANELKVIYENYGMGVFIDVGTSTTGSTIVKEYDGMTIEEGFANPCFVNNLNGTSRIRNPKIYAFKDPIDTPEMMSFARTIIEKNILNHSKDGNYIPTVVLAPRISQDMDSFIEYINKAMSRTSIEGRPPLLIVTNFSAFYDQFMDIAQMCGCRLIQKYIDPKMQKEAISRGDAPTLNNVDRWAAGSAELVESDTLYTKFVRPKNFFDKDGNYSVDYKTLISFLNQQLDEAQKNGEGANVTGNLKRRINSLKANMVELLIGGVSNIDIESFQDLVEDAVLNCRSAAANGCGYAANVEGLCAAYELATTNIELPEWLDDNDKNLYEQITLVFKSAYIEVEKLLLSTAMTISEDDIDKIVEQIIVTHKPYNIVTNEFDEKLLSSINSDIYSLDSISKILSIMITANQCFLDNPVMNIYEDSSTTVIPDTEAITE